MRDSVRDWFECEEGYPTQDSLDRLEKHEFTLESAASFLRDDLPEIVKGISCVRVWADSWTEFGKDRLRISYATGGWSGAEDLIQAMLSHFWLNYHHCEWRRGGLFVFDVPKAIEVKEDEG